MGHIIQTFFIFVFISISVSNIEAQTFPIFYINNFYSKSEAKEKKVKSVTEYIYGYSFGKPQSNGKKATYKEYDRNGNYIVEENYINEEYSDLDLPVNYKFKYDENDRIIELERTEKGKNLGKAIYKYDTNLLIEAVVYNNKGEFKEKYIYTHDYAGNIIKETPINFSEDYCLYEYSNGYISKISTMSWECNLEYSISGEIKKRIDTRDDEIFKIEKEFYYNGGSLERIIEVNSTYEGIVLSQYKYEIKTVNGFITEKIKYDYESNEPILMFKYDYELY